MELFQNGHLARDFTAQVGRKSFAVNYRSHDLLPT
jgi:hypothetical protein